jgi:hypothetical protein
MGEKRRWRESGHLMRSLGEAKEPMLGFGVDLRRFWLTAVQ